VSDRRQFQRHFSSVLAIAAAAHEGQLDSSAAGILGCHLAGVELDCERVRFRSHLISQIKKRTFAVAFSWGWGSLMANVEAEAFHVGEGRRYSLGPITLAFKTTTASYTLSEATLPPGTGTGLHRHLTFDQMQILVEGRCEAQFADKSVFLGPGDSVFLPKGVVHGLMSLGPGSSRLLIVTTPAGLLEMFVAEAATALNGIGGSMTPGGSGNFRAIAAKHGLEWLEADDRLLLTASPNG
jgi:mannose-6-phosphate isomerase-like protein (cupin superfamily)